MATGVRLQIETFGEDAVNRDLLRFGVRSLDATPAFIKISEDMSADLAELFASEGSSSGHPWAALADSTVLYKSQQNLDPRILHATLDLRNSLVNPADSDAINLITDDSLTKGTNVDYAIFHRKGTAKMPKRDPADLNEIQKRGYVKTLQRWVVEGVIA